MQDVQTVRIEKKITYMWRVRLILKPLPCPALLDNYNINTSKLPILFIIDSIFQIYVHMLHVFLVYRYTSFAQFLCLYGMCICNDKLKTMQRLDVYLVSKCSSGYKELPRAYFILNKQVRKMLRHFSLWNHSFLLKFCLWS